MNREAKNLWISLGAAVFSIFLIYSYIQEKSFEAAKGYGDSVQVVVAKQDIKAMQTINESMLSIEKRPSKFVEKKSVKNSESIIGQVALAPISSGEMLLSNKVLQPNPVTGLSLQVAPTKRAVTIPVSDAKAVGRLIKPGDRIDILSTFDVDKGNKKIKEVHTVFQDITILATGHRIQNQLPIVKETSGNTETLISVQEDVKFSHVTVELSPSEAQDLVYILSVHGGELYMTLRHPSDHTRTLFESATQSETIRRRLQRSPASTQ